jgi:hypothetical protein
MYDAHLVTLRLSQIRHKIIFGKIADQASNFRKKEAKKSDQGLS